MEEMKTLTVNGETYKVTDDAAVHTTGQTLTEEQQAQARRNIGAIGKTDYATGSSAGVGKSSSNLGVYCVNESGYWQIKSASVAEITEKSHGYRPIVPKYLDQAVKAGVTANAIALTQQEQQAACNWLGSGVITANADGSLSVQLSDGTYRISATKEA